MTDDYAGSRATTGRVTVGNPVTGTIESAGDEDWFAVVLEGGVEYHIDLEGAPTGGGTLADPFLRWLHDANGAGIRNTRDHDGGEGLNARQVFRPEEGGTYYISANGAGGETGTYRLSVTQVDPAPGGDDDDSGDVVQTGTEDATPVGGTVTAAWPSDPPPVVSVSEGDADLPTDTTTTGVVVVGGSVTGTIESAGDQDWYAVALEGGVEYRIDLEGSPTGGGTLSDPLLRWLHDANGAGVPGTRDDDGGEGANARQVFRPTEGGTYYISANGADSETGTYRLSVTQVDPPPDDYTDGTSTTGTVAVDGDPATGTVERGADEDWFEVELEAGKTYRFDLEGTGDDALSDPVLRGIHDAAGTLLDDTADTDTADSGAGASSRVHYTAEADGIHYVAAGARDGATGTYALSVTEEGPLMLAVADVEGTEGEDAALVFTVTLDREPWETVTVRYATADGTAVAGADYEEASGTLTFAPSETEKTVSVTLIDDADEGDGETLRLVLSDATGAELADAEATGTLRDTDDLSSPVSEEAGGEDLSADTTTKGVVPAGHSATGEIGTEGDRDWFAVKLEAGKTYRFELEGTGDDALSDPVLRGIHDATGTLLDDTADTTDTDDTDTDNTDNDSDSDDTDAGTSGRVTYTAEADDTYYVAVGADGGATGTYTLSAVEVLPSLRVEDAEAHEGEDTEIVFRVTLDRVPLETVTVPWETRDGTAEAGADYEADSGTLTFAPGETEKTVSVTLIDDADEDSGETFTLALGTPTGADLADAEATGIIWNTEETSVSEGGTDLPAGTTTTGVVAVDGDPATGTIGSASDEDWFSVVLEAGKTYQFDLEGADTGDGTLSDPYLRGIYNSSDDDPLDHTTDDDSGSGLNSRVYFAPTVAGTYYVAAGAYGDEQGTYTLSVTEVVDDYAASSSTTGTVVVDGDPATGTIERPGDQDWFEVTLQADQTYRFDLEGSSGYGTLWNPYLRGIYDANAAANGEPLAGTTNSYGGVGLNSRVYFTPTVAGAYYVAAGGAGNLQGAYTLSVIDVTDGEPDDHAASTSMAGAVEVDGDPATGEIQYVGDEDWFAVTLQADQTYRFDLEGRFTGAGTLCDPHLRGIYDANAAANGEPLAGTTDRDSGVGLNSRVYFTPTAAGTYYVAAGGAEDGQGAYTLSVIDVTDGEPDDYAASTSMSGTVEVDGDPATGEIQYAGDEDWFAVVLEGGVEYRIDLEGNSTGAGTLCDPYLRGIYDVNAAADGEPLAGTTDDDSGTGINSRVVFTPTATGTYYVAAGAYGDREGTYELSVTEVVDAI